MKNEPLISVIVPVYNVAIYLDKCINSIANQTYGNLEIILIDDGSTDESGVMCDAWATKDSRVRVFHKENAGQSSARNRGLQEAHGQYIGYVDGDDCIDATMYATLLDILVRESADAVGCQFKCFRDKIPTTMDDSNRLYSYSGRELCNKLLDTEGEVPMISFSVWKWLFKATVAKMASFEEGVYYEDAIYPLHVFWSQKKIVFLDKSMYFYRIRENSTMTMLFTSKHAKDAVNFIRHQYDFYQKNGDINDIIIARSSILKTILEYRFQCRPDMSAERAAFTRLIKEYRLGYNDVRSRNFKQWLKYIVYRYFYRFYRWVRFTYK